LNQLLIALAHQTMKPERIIVSDDSPQLAFRSHLLSEPLRSSIEDMNVEVVDGPHTGAYNNCLHLLDIWGGATALVHMLFDDDVIYPTFYERHLQAHAQQACSCSISRRWTAIESGQPVGQLEQPAAIIAHAHRTLFIDADYAFATTVPYCNNWFGEMSNAVFSHDASRLFKSASLAGISFEGLADIGFFLSASLQRPLGFLNEPLSCFRLNPGQTTGQLSGVAGKMGYLAWIALAIAGKRIGKIQQEQAMQCFQRISNVILDRFAGVEDMARFCLILPGLTAVRQGSEELFLEEWESFLATARAGS
jgi:hypothetical protein